jgi:hypothetical protein
MEKITSAAALAAPRNRLFAQVFEDVFQHWNEPIEGRNISKGMAALEVMRKERPADYVQGRSLDHAEGSASLRFDACRPR